MKFSLTLLLLSIFAPLYSQSFQEICHDQNTNGTIVDFARYQGDILATGFFTTICGEETNHIAKWENESWTASDIILPGAGGHHLRPIGDDLYLASYVEGQDSNWLFKYDGVALEKVGAGFFLSTATSYSQLANIYDAIEYQGAIIACGEFDRVGGQTISGIAKWNGTSWESMGDLMGNIPNTPVLMFPHRMMVYNDELYVVGNFGSAGGVAVNGIAKWNGTVWSALGDGFNSTAYGIGVYKNEIYVGGDFTKSADTELNRIAKWNGNEWISLGFGFMPISINDYTFIHTIKEINDELWILGGLREIHYEDGSSELCGGIISYDGENVQTFNEGIINNDIEAIIEDDEGNILVGGGIFGNGYAGILELPTQTTSQQQLLNINIHPNPTKNDLQIDTDENILNWQLFNTLGKLLKYENSPTTNINLKDFDAGVYILNIKTENGQKVLKIIKN